MPGLYPDAPDAAGVPFTDDARRLLADARAESDRLRHEFVGTEHVVLALTRGSVGTALLARFGVDPEQVRASLDGILTPGHAALPPGAERPYTSRTRQSFGLAAASAEAHGHAGVGVAHVVLGLLRERMNLGAQVLQQHGLSQEHAAAAVERHGREDGPR
jgi:ATP-dependent Clp protease ATP-binding subunit ClpC